MRTSALTFVCCAVSFACGQQAPKPAQPEATPPMKLNYLNVCRPSADEQTEIRNVFAKVAAHPAFTRDFEVSRGRATFKEEPDSVFVRLRRDLAPESPLMTAQYSMSTDEANTIETLVLRSRDARDFHELSFEDRVSSGAASPLTVLGVDTPVTRIRVERFGKKSIVLARCPDADQSEYEAMFRTASDLMARYRKALGLRTAFRTDIAWLTAQGTKTAGAKTDGAKAAPKKPAK